jgi:hypothetical protein
MKWDEVGFLSVPLYTYYLFLTKYPPKFDEVIKKNLFSTKQNLKLDKGILNLINKDQTHLTVTPGKGICSHGILTSMPYSSAKRNKILSISFIYTILAKAEYFFINFKKL